MQAGWGAKAAADFLHTEMTPMMNPFESGERKVIPATLIYLFCEDHVLMIHRIKKNRDIHEGKWNGIGGKLELGESPWEGAAREIAEETGIAVSEENLQALGTLTFPNFKAFEEQDWICFLFRALLTGKRADYALIDPDEGKLEWIPRGKLMDLNLWEGDKSFLPHVLAGEAFLGSYWYEEKKLVKYTLKKI